jgi:glucosamine 6-phosphate synthetase-like amidotransferase/phosphosugar isomerase protein
LKRLEYRGYDSAGVMLYDGEKLKVSKPKESSRSRGESFKEITTNGRQSYTLGNTWCAKRCKFSSAFQILEI